MTANQDSTQQEPGTRRTCLLVLGMHRSGTSAVARVLNLLGAALPENLLGAGPGNEAGHWEPARLVALHDQMLAEAGSSWNDWQAFDPASLPPGRATHYKGEIVRLIEEEYGDAALFVLKDPRICRFVPLCDDALAMVGCEPRAVIMVRNPLEVAASLNKRDGMAHDRAALLWLRHVLDAEAATRGRPRAFLSYDNLLADWKAALDGLAARLGVVWPRASGEVDGEVGEFLTSAQRHHEIATGRLDDDPAMNAWVAEAFAALRELERDPASAEATGRLDAISREFRNAAPVMARLESETRQHKAELEGQAAALSEASARAGALAGQLKELEVALSEKERSEQGLHKEMDTLKMKLEKANTKREATEAEKDRLEKTLQQSQAQQEEARSRLRRVEDEQSRTRAELEQARLESQQLSAETERLQAEKSRDEHRAEQLSTVIRRMYELRGPVTKWMEKIGRIIRPQFLSTAVLLPANNIVPNGMPHGWRATGPDPQLFVPVSAAASFFRVKYRARMLEAADHVPVKWQLFFDDGLGFREELSQARYSTDGVIDIDQIIYRKTVTFGFRLDPVDRPCEFVIDEFQIMAMFSFWARLSLAWRRILDVRRRGQFREYLSRAFCEMRAGRTRQLLYRLFQPVAESNDVYKNWIVQRHVSQLIRNKFIEKMGDIDGKTNFSIIMPTYNSPVEFLRMAINSVINQTYENWELIVTDDGSTKTDHFKALEEFAKSDKRIKVEYLSQNAGISAASNNAIARARGDYIVLFDHDDELAPHALHAFADAIDKDPTADWLYSDEDKIDEKGNRFGAYFKPDWSPAFFLSCMYTCHLGAYRRSLVEELGGFRGEFDMAQDYDLALRFASVTDRVVHIPDILYHWRTLPQSTASGSSAKPIAELRARQAVQSFIDRGAYKGRAIEGPLPGTHRVVFDIIGEPLVSIAIPSAGRRSHVPGRDSWLVLDLVKSIRERSTYRNIEIVIAENGDFETELRSGLEQYDVKIVLYDAATFNIADKINLTVGATSGEYVVILNDDMEIISPDWIEQMLMWGQQEGVCGVGARLLFPDGRIQHAGVMLLGQGPSHVYYLEPRTQPGLAGNAVSPRECSAVTGACMLLRRADFIGVGGFDPRFRINYNDVDFCLRLIEHTGGRIIYTPYAELYHYESVSREAAPSNELSIFNEKWKSYVGFDPYYNRNLSPTSNCFEPNVIVRNIEKDYGLEL